MTTIVLGPRPPVVEAWLEERRAKGLDGFDEVWEGEYVVVPMAHPRHGLVDQQVAVILDPLARAAGLIVSSPLNLGHPDNYRVPDRVLLRTTPTTTYVATAALVVEVVSPDDRSRRKLDFYAAREVDEVVLVDPCRRSVELFGREQGRMVPRSRSRLIDLAAADLAARIDWPEVDDDG
jgi:Uma2 family endonuclease